MEHMLGKHFKIGEHHGNLKGTYIGKPGKMTKKSLSLSLSLLPPPPSKT
jgi:hypothetical protein